MFILQRRRIWASASAVMLALVCFLQAPGHGQQPNAAGQEKQAGTTKTRLYFGVSACTPCHSNPEQYKNEPPILCTCDEFNIWQNKDKHKDAYANLFKERGNQINRLLTFEKQEVEKNCITCHGVHIENEKF